MSDRCRPPHRARGTGRHVACVVLVCTLLPACRSGGKGGAIIPEDEVWISREAIEKGAVKVVEARTQALAEPLPSDGRIAFDDLRVSHVFSPVTGRVTRVLAELGQTVEKGSPLAAIVSPDVGTAFSDEVKARADLVATEREYKRQQTLFAEQAGSQRDFETAENAYRKAQVEEQRALQKRRLLSEGTVNAVTQEYVLQSPIAGRVVARMVTPGVEVQGQYSAGTAVELFTIGDTDLVWLYADVPEAELADLQAGAAATARVLAYPASVFEGNVEWVSTALDPALRTARIRVSLPNPERLLKPEMFATVYVRRPSAEKLAVPRGAVVRINEQSFVYVAGGFQADGKQTFKRRHVQVAAQRDPTHSGVLRGVEGYSSGTGGAQDMVAVLSGLSEGESVLVESEEAHQFGTDKVSLTKDQMLSGKLGTAAAEEQDVSNTVTVGGRLTFDDLRVTHVFSPVTGRITRIMAAPGEHVKKGAPLALILSPDLGSAFSDELKAKADLLAAEKEVKRQREMYTLQATARHDLEVAEDNYDRARAEHERALQKTSLLREGTLDSVNQEYVLRSPIDGEVVARMASPGLEVQGQYSGASSVVELFTIGSIDDLWLLGDVYEVDLPSVKAGAQVELQVPAYPGRSFRGTADWVSDTLDPVLRTAKARVVLENPQGVLRPEMYGVARITAPARRMVTAPRDAIMRLGDETIVFVESAHDAAGGVTFQRRAVVADEQLAGDAVPVVAGLQAGERVATRGAILLLGML